MVMGCVGIPRATFYGNFAARNVLGEADEDSKNYFNYFFERALLFPAGLRGQDNWQDHLFLFDQQLAKFFQVDKLRSHEGREKEF
jgi:gamma-glutamylputrescine oxidase